MKVKLSQLIAAVQPLHKLFGASLPIRTTFRLKKIIKEINANLTFYDESKTELLKKYGTEGENNTFEVKEGKQDELNKEHKELVDTEISLGFEPLSMEVLGNIEMSTEELMLLEWLIVE